jgi:hypothetical protein
VSSAELPGSGECKLTADALLAGPLGRLLRVNLLDDRLETPAGGSGASGMTRWA